jgi:serine/threonine protein kinase
MAFPTTSFAAVTEPDRKQLQSWLADFERTWQEGRLEEWVLRLPLPGHRLRLPALIGLVQTDLRLQWQRGRRVQVEAYLKIYPELGSPEKAPVDLILAEYEAQRQCGAPADWAEIVRRFPHQQTALASLWRQGPASALPSPPAPPTRYSVASHHSTHPSARPAGAPSSLPEQFGRYRIIRQLGRGAMGTVFLAHDTLLDRQVALKVPHFAEDDPDLLERFTREARAAAVLNHPNICPVHDVGQIDGIHYLTMAYVEGRPLAELLRSASPLPQRQAAAIVCTIAQALQEAHERGVIHRDLKPSNIMINQRQEPVIMDFGLARRVHGVDVRLTQSGALVGTPGYMAPEQVSGDTGKLGPACDIYSLGVILYELLTGRLPFEGPLAAVLAQVLTQAPRPPSEMRPDLARPLEAICLRAMSKKAADRYRTMGELAAALAGCLGAPNLAAEASRLSSPPGSLVLGSQSAPPPLPGSVRQSCPPPLPLPDARWRRPPGHGKWWIIGSTAVVVVSAAVLLGMVLVKPSRRAAVKSEEDPAAAKFEGGATKVEVGLDRPKPEPVPSEPALRPGTVTIDWAPADADVRVQVDGETFDRARRKQPLPLTAGEHTLRIDGDDFEPVRQAFTIKPGEGIPLTVPLTRRTWDVARYLPAETALVMHLNFRQILDSPLFKKHFERKLKDFLKDHVLAQMLFIPAGIDPFTDMASVTVAFADVDVKEARIMGVLRGRFDPTRIQVIWQEDGRKLHEVPDGAGGKYRIYEASENQNPVVPQRTFWAVVDERTIVYAPAKEWVQNACAQAAGHEKPALNKAVQTLLAEVDPHPSLWFAATGDLRNARQTLRDELNVESICGSLTIAGGVKAQVLCDCRDADAAQKANEEMHRGLIGAMQMLVVAAEKNKELTPFVEVLKNVKAVAQDRRVAVEGGVPAAVIDKVLDPAVVDQWLRDLGEQLSTVTKNAAVEFNDAIIAHQKKVITAANQFSETLGRALEGGKAEDLARLREARLEMKKLAEDAQKSLKALKVPASPSGLAFLQAAGQFFDRQARFVNEDFAELVRLAGDRTLPPARRQMRISEIALRVKQAEEAEEAALRKAQQAFAREHHFTLR